MDKLITMKILKDIISGKIEFKEVPDKIVKAVNKGLLKDERFLEDFNPTKVLDHIISYMEDFSLDTKIKLDTNHNILSKNDLIRFIVKNKPTTKELSTLFGKNLSFTPNELKKEDALSFYFAAIQHNNIDMIQYLIDNKISMNIQGERLMGNTPLNQALKVTNIEIAKLLIDNGADPELSNEMGGNAIHHSTMPKDISILKLLIEKGVDLNTKDTAGNTALTFAIVNTRKDIVEILLKKEGIVLTQGGFNLIPLIESNIIKDEENKDFWKKLKERFEKIHAETPIK